MSKRSRQRARTASPSSQRQLNPPREPGGPTPLPAEPERLLLDQIAVGALDAHLTAIADAIYARQELLETVNSAKALAMLNVGDRVRFNHHTRPQYLRGVEGVVIELDQHTATVCVHGPVGRFRSGTIRECPPLLLERLPQPPDQRRTTMTPADTGLDDLIWEITVDAHDEDEQLMGFEAAFEDAGFPCTGTVVGEEVQVLSVSRADHRHELTATCQRDGHTYEVALLDVHLSADAATSRLIAAYRRWLGA